jgi:hypothetical protein
MIANLRWLWDGAASVFIATALILCLLLIAMVMQKRETKENPGWWALAIGLLVQLLILWAMIGKHPQISYLLSVSAVLPILLALALDVFLERGLQAQKLAGLIGGIALIGFVIGLTLAIQNHYRGVYEVRRTEEVISLELQKYARSAGKSIKDMTILWGYGVPSRCLALRFGNVYTEAAIFRSEINEFCPNEWMYNVWSGRVELLTASGPLSENKDWDIVILPEKFIPESSGYVGEITLTDARTRRYGRVAIIKTSFISANK